jgi:hypothetical protein
MAGHDHVDAGHHRGQLAVHVEAVVRQQHNHFGTVGARLVDVCLQGLGADAE